MCCGMLQTIMVYVGLTLDTLELALVMLRTVLGTRTPEGGANVGDRG